MAYFASLRHDGGEGNDVVNVVLTGQTCKERYAECQKEKEGENCKPGCTDSSVNNDALEGMDACMQTCAGYPADENDSKKACAFFTSAVTAVKQGTCCPGVPMIESEVQGKVEKCLSSGSNFEFGCCNDNCKKPCSDTEQTRVGLVIVGALLTVIGLIMAATFSCGLAPCCCFAKEMEVVQPPQAYAGNAQPVVMATAVPTVPQYAPQGKI